MLDYINLQGSGEWDKIKMSNDEYEEILSVLRQMNKQSADVGYKKSAGRLTPDRLIPRL